MLVLTYKSNIGDNFREILAQVAVAKVAETINKVSNLKAFLRLIQALSLNIKLLATEFKLKKFELNSNLIPTLSLKSSI